MNTFVPPEDIRIGVGAYKDPGRFVADGQRNFQKLIADGLSPEDSVLDVGCGCGRLSPYIAQHLSPAGTYVGLDADPDAVAWCVSDLQPTFPNARFIHCDVFNAEYNPRGSIRPIDYVFPFPGNTFTYVFAESLFTHMFLADTEHYLKEIHRVLRPGGRFRCTYLLLTEASREGIRKGTAYRNLSHPIDRAMTFSREVPEKGVAFSEGDIVALYRSIGFKIREVRHGDWWTIKTNDCEQDVITAEKERQPAGSDYRATRSV